MRASEITPASRLNEQVFRLTSYLLVALMLACATATVVSLLMRLVTGWRPWYLVGISFFVALDALYSSRIFKKLSFLTSEWPQAAGAQIVILLVALRAVIGLSHGVGAFWVEISAGWFAFFQSFFAVEYLLALGLVALTWMLSLAFADLLDEMGLDAALIRLDEGAAAPREARPPRERLIGLIFSIGTWLVILTALLRLDFNAALAGKLDASILHVPSLANGGASTLLYFMLALALFSETQFIALHTRWSLNRVPINPGMAGRWVLYSLIFLVLLAALTSLLPTDYSLGFLTTLGYMVSILGGILYLIGQLLLMLLFLLVSLPFLLFGKKSPIESPIVTPLQPPPASGAAAPAAASIPWVEIVKSFAFWAVFLGILIFSLVQYLRQHEDLLTTLRQRPGLGWLAKFLDWLRSAWQSTQKGITEAVSAGWQRIRPRRTLSQTLGGWINLRRLDPRQRVFFFYQAFLRRSGESGLPRSLSQTPNEFASRLDSALPDAEPDIDALTSAFIEARYTPRPVEPEKANRARETWEHLRKVLRGKKAESGK